MNPYKNRMEELEARIVRQDDGVQSISLTETEIAAAESVLGQKLPEEYRIFLQDFGCYELYTFYPCNEGYGGWGGINLFYGLTPLDSHPFPFDIGFDLLAQYKTFKPYLPVELIAIGDNNGNTVTCIALDGAERGGIYLWDRIESFDGTDYKGIHFVASSFDEFMKLLLTEDQYDNIPR